MRPLRFGRGRTETRSGSVEVGPERKRENVARGAKGLMQSERPNFLFLMSDQQRADSLGMVQAAVEVTPALNRLSAAGTACSSYDGKVRRGDIGRSAAGVT